MIGPSPAARGGMATVVATLLDNGYADGGRCRFIATHVDGGPARKAVRAAGALLEFAGLLARGKVALLHVHVASGVSFWRKAAFIKLAQAAGCPVIFHLHGGEFRDFLERRLSERRRRFALSMMQRCTAGFALTQDSAAWLSDKCGMRIVEVFPNPISAPHLDMVDVRRARTTEILFLGRLEEKKGVFDLVRAFAIVHQKLPEARLVLGGDGDAEKIRELAEELGVAPLISLLGWVGPRQKAELLGRAAVFVLPSHFEQMPMTILEAMSFGTPVVATNVGAVPEMLAHGKPECVVSVKQIAALAASILSIMTDNIRRDTLAMQGLERVRSEYIVETVINRLRRRYQELQHEKIS